jgi:hypothetical protein
MASAHGFPRRTGFALPQTVSINAGNQSQAACSICLFNRAGVTSETTAAVVCTLKVKVVADFPAAMEV